MKQNTLSSLFASIDAQRDALRCESAVVEFFPVIESLTLKESILPSSGKLSIRPFITLRRRSDNVSVELEAYTVVSPRSGEGLFDYIDRLFKHVDFIDDHAKFIEVEILQHN